MENNNNFFAFKIETNIGDLIGNVVPKKDMPALLSAIPEIVEMIHEKNIRLEGMMTVRIKNLQTKEGSEEELWEWVRER
jgi:hypothetical protein